MRFGNHNPATMFLRLTVILLFTVNFANARQVIRYFQISRPDGFHTAVSTGRQRHFHSRQRH